MDDTLRGRLDETIDDARAALLALQDVDGHWLFELEADVTIPAEYILLKHYLDEVDSALQEKLAAYIREKQMEDGGWPLFEKGEAELNATIKGYFALKLAGDDDTAPHMVRAARIIREKGGLDAANVFTKVSLALFDQCPWEAVPVMPVEIMCLPRWFPFHLEKVSYWSRTVIVPLLILMALKPRARNPRQVRLDELWAHGPAGQSTPRLANPTGTALGRAFLLLDRLVRRAEPFFPKGQRLKAIEAAVDFIKERLNGEDGLGGIFPAMANTVMAFDALGYGADHPDMIIAKKSIEKLVVVRNGSGYCQPCLSPVWDTALIAHTLMETGMDCNEAPMRRSLDWLVDKQVLDTVGDWAVNLPGTRPGGWAFQYENPHYPDVDDTAVALMALDRANDPKYRENSARAIEWIMGMQSRNGGWGAFDKDNTYHYLNYIPFADHGALLDPPTADVSARCLSALAQAGFGRDHPAVAQSIAYLRREQEADGSWFGRWGTNYIYGTWSVLCALNAAGEDMRAPYIARAVEWIKRRQREDGGWGEDGATYWEETREAVKESTPSQTAWAILGLMAANEVDSPAVERGIQYLLNTPRDGAKWQEELYTAVGFPRVFFLRYDGYSAYFPLWALARYRNLKAGNTPTVLYGM